MITPLTREAVNAQLAYWRFSPGHGSMFVDFESVAAALLAAWDERDGLRKEFDAVVAMLSEMHGAEYSRAEAAEEDITTYQEIVSAMTQDAEAAEAKLAERDAENARLRDLFIEIQQWASAYPSSVFPEPDFKRANELLQAGGMSIDAVSASNMRHVLSGLDRIVSAAITGDKP